MAQHRLDRDGRVPSCSALGLALSAPLLTWWAGGLHNEHLPDHDVGPYHLPLLGEYLAGTVALVVAVVAFIGMRWPPRAPSPRRLSARTTLLLVAVGVVAAASWRIATPGTDGANIGGGAVRLAGPLVVGALLIAAVYVEKRSRGGRLPRTWIWILFATLIVPALYALEAALT